ncbi:hypothetical protein HGRIS_010023 [Hohenbuehelia grisea]|uniref:MARVEL domain-containing protein n=1 Tax=Hohenbuehelia grisea TaxID=104357 RepID=A0ABR3J307_9AGAR
MRVRFQNAQQQQHSYPSSSPSGLRALFSVFSSRAPGMTLFNAIRTSIYVTVFVFTLICLAMAGHFQTVLASSDLTRFVPFAIFVCTASLVIIVTLLSFSFIKKERNPISTRIELACLGLVGTFWLVLGVFLTTSESQSADVECFTDQTNLVPIDESLASFQTDQYHAMYRVLMAFALINAFLMLFSFVTLLVLALMRHYTGDEHMWYGPVTSCAWFNRYQSSTLPGPGGKAGVYREKSQGSRRTQPSRSQSYSHSRSHSRGSPRQPSRTVQDNRGRTQRPRHDAYARNASPRR